MDAYSSGDARGLPPHVYAIASAAYKKMRSEGKGQAILVSQLRGRGCHTYHSSGAEVAVVAVAATAAAATAAGAAEAKSMMPTLLRVPRCCRVSC